MSTYRGGVSEIIMQHSMMYSVFPSFPPPRHYQNQERLDKFTSKSGEGCPMVRIYGNGLRYLDVAPENIAVNLSKKNREIRIVWTGLHRYPGLEAILCGGREWK